MSVTFHIPTEAEQRAWALGKRDGALAAANGRDYDLTASRLPDYREGYVWGWESTLEALGY